MMWPIHQYCAGALKKTSVVAIALRCTGGRPAYCGTIH
jgi:hypothetical protein